MKISACCFTILIAHMIPYKIVWISMCLVLECWIWILVRLIALVLSQSKGTLLTFNPKSSRYCLIQRIFAQQLPTTIYSTFAVERATQTCLFLCQYMSLALRIWHVPLVLFLSSLHLWLRKMSSFNFLTCNPKKKDNSPIIDISNSPCIAATNS